MGRIKLWKNKKVIINKLKQNNNNGNKSKKKKKIVLRIELTNSGEGWGGSYFPYILEDLVSSPPPPFSPCPPCTNLSWPFTIKLREDIILFKIFYFNPDFWF